jgi:hypothetical protein
MKTKEQTRANTEAKPKQTTVPAAQTVPAQAKGAERKTVRTPTLAREFLCVNTN